LQFITRKDLAFGGGRAALRLSPPLEALVHQLVKLSPADPVDRSLSDDVARLADWIRAGDLPAETRAGLRFLVTDSKTHGS